MLVFVKLFIFAKTEEVKPATLPEYIKTCRLEFSILNLHLEFSILLAFSITSAKLQYDF